MDEIDAILAIKRFSNIHQTRLKWWLAYAGDGQGNIYTSQANYYLCRYPLQSSPTHEIFNNRINMIDNLRIIVGYTAYQPNLLQVLDVADQRLDTQDPLDNPINPGSIGYSRVLPHWVNHQYLGSDSGPINFRQLSSLGVFPTSPASLSVQIWPGTIPRPGADVNVAYQAVDLTASVPSSGIDARYTLISFDSTGAVVVTDGTVNTGGVSALTNADVPATPAGNWRSCAVMLYTGQTAIVENNNEIDFLDLRFPEESIAGSLSPDQISGATAQYQYIVSGAATAFTPAWSTGFLNITTAKTLAVSNSMTLAAGADGYTATLPKTGTLATGTGTAGRVAEWVTDANTLQASTLAKTGAGVLTIDSSTSLIFNTPTTLGDTLYHNGTDVVRLAGNITAVQKFLSQTGNGSVSAAPSWQPLPVAGLATFFFIDAASSIGGAYKQAVSSGNYTPAVKASLLTAGATTNTVVGTFATNAGFPGLSFIPDGTFHLHIHAKHDGGTATLTLGAHIYQRDGGGTETLITTSEDTAALTTSEAEYDVAAILTQPYALATTDRIVVKWFVVSASAARDVTIYYDGTGVNETFSRIEMPTAAIDSSTFVPYTGATTALDMGAHPITATVINLSATSNQIVMQSAGVTGTLTWTPASSNKVITLPNLTGTLPVGTGTAGRLAEWVTNANTLQASTLIKTGAGIVTIDSSDTMLFALSGVNGFGFTNSMDGTTFFNIYAPAAGKIGLQVLGGAASYYGNIEFVSTKTLQVSDNATVSGTNTGDVTLASPNHGLGLTGQVLTLGTPSSITSTSTNSVTTTTHTHAITGSLGLLGNASAQYHIPISGATPFAYAESGFLLDGTTGGKTILNVTNTKILTFTSADTYTVTVAGTASIAGTNTGDVTLASPNHGLGLTGQVLTLGTPSSSTVSSTNAVTTTTHTHAVTSSSSPGAAASLIATDASGRVTLTNISTRFGLLSSAFLDLPMLRGFWPISSIDENGNAFDLSGQGRTLTNTNAATFSILSNVVPYATFNGSNQYFTRSDEAGLSITGAFTMGIWVAVLSTNNFAGVIGKFNTSGNQRSYLILQDSAANNRLLGIVSSNGTAETSVPSSVAMGTGWHFICLRYTPSTELAIFDNGTKATNTTSIPASIFDSTTAFEIASRDVATYPTNCNASLGFLCAAALPDQMLGDLLAITRTAFGI